MIQTSWNSQPNLCEKIKTIVLQKLYRRITEFLRRAKVKWNYRATSKKKGLTKIYNINELIHVQGTKKTVVPPFKSFGEGVIMHTIGYSSYECLEGKCDFSLQQTLKKKKKGSLNWRKDSSFEKQCATFFWPSSEWEHSPSRASLQNGYALYAQ